MSESRAARASELPNESGSVSYCDCYGTDGPMCAECEAEEREQDEQRSADLFLEDVFLYGI